MLLKFIQEQLQCVDLVVWNQMPLGRRLKREYTQKKKELNATLAQSGPHDYRFRYPPIFANRVQFISHNKKKLPTFCAYVYINFYIQLNSINRSNTGHITQMLHLALPGWKEPFYWLRQ